MKTKKDEHNDMLKAVGFDEAIIGTAVQAGSEEVYAYCPSKCISILMKCDDEN